jgi:ABC-type multidrug transport system fused ATPase/permease subunit
VVLFTIDPALAVIAVAAIPILAWLALQQRTKVRLTQQAARAEAGHLATAATDLLGNVRAIQAFGRQRRAEQLFEASNRAALATELDAIAVEARWSPRSDLLLAAASGLVLVVGADRVLSGSMTTGTLLVVLAYLSSLYRPVRSLARLASTFAKASASAARVQEVLDCSERVVEAPDAVIAPPIDQSVRFNNVSFAYATGRPVLDDVDFEIRAGETVCLWGPSGAGKTTLLHLLLRLYDVDAGGVTLDGIDVRRCSLASLRSRVGFVPQDPWLLDGTIADNIAFGAESVSRAQVLAAGRTAWVDEFALDLPRGYDSSVGEGGSQLSGGQRRRVAVARAIVSDAPLLLLDEPTASLDAASVDAVLAAIRAAGTQRTVVVVTHDQRLADLADRVVPILRPLSNMVKRKEVIQCWQRSPSGSSRP